MEASQPTRLLIIRFSSIGDIVLTSPVIRCIKAQLEGEVQIHYITKKVFASIISRNPLIDRVITIEKHVSEVADQLKEGGYDYVIDLHNNLRSKQVKRLTKALHFTIDKRNLAKWIYVQTKREILPIGHVVARSLETLAPLGVQDDHQGLDFHFSSEDLSQNLSLPTGFQSNYVAFVIGGQMQGKVLPAEKIIEICNGLTLPVVLVGGPEDRALGETVSGSMTNACFNACGAFSLHESARIIQESNVVIAHDTGLMHVAVALNKPLISLWLATTPELGFAPWMPKAPTQLIQANCKKRPTSKLGNRGYADGCVYNIDTAAVAEAANALSA